jgi:hypothetical protein
MLSERRDAPWVRTATGALDTLGRESVALSVASHSPDLRSEQKKEGPPSPVTAMGGVLLLW